MAEPCWLRYLGRRLAEARRLRSERTRLLLLWLLLAETEGVAILWRSRSEAVAPEIRGRV